MTDHPVLDKVTAFVTRGPAEARELLVFRHPNGGVQVPAGTVEEGEPVAEAALRETWEETGLKAVAIVAELGAKPSPLRLDDRTILHRVHLLQEPAFDALEVVQPFPSFLGLRRGLFVRQVGESGDYAQVVYEEYDGPAHQALAPARSVSGWIPVNAITPIVVRHFFHLTPTEPTPDTWIQSAEEWEHRFELYWAPLPTAEGSVEGLVPSQAAWLTEYADQLRR